MVMNGSENSEPQEQIDNEKNLPAYLSYYIANGLASSLVITITILIIFLAFGWDVNQQNGVTILSLVIGSIALLLSCIIFAAVIIAMWPLIDIVILIFPWWGQQVYFVYILLRIVIALLAHRKIVHSAGRLLDLVGDVSAPKQTLKG